MLGNNTKEKGNITKMANPIFAAINSGTTINVATMTTIGKGDELQPAITNLLSTRSLDQAKSKLVESKVKNFSYVATQADSENTTDSIVYVTNKFSFKRDMEQIKIDLSITDDYQVDHFSFEDTALFCALPKTTAENITNTLKDLHKSSSSITSLEVVTVFLYRRVYDANNCTAIVNFTDAQVSVVVVEKTSPIWTGALSIVGNDDPVSVVLKLLSEFKSSIPNVSIERVLLCGDATRTYLDSLVEAYHTRSISVEFFYPLANNLINVSLLPQVQLNLLEREGHKFVPVIGANLMSLEGSGADLSSNQQQLVKRFSNTPELNVPFNIVDTLVEVSTMAKHKVVAAATSQNKMLGLALIVGLGLVGYNYYETNQKINQIDSSIEVETKIAAQLKPFEDKYKQYQQRLTVKNNQINQIREIQKSQLTIPTILGELQNVQFPLAQLVNFSDIEIEGRSLKVAGNAIDKAQTIELLDKLRSSNTSRFLDINPTYSSTDFIRCNFSFSASYAGPIQPNNTKLPISTTTINQVAQIAAK